MSARCALPAASFITAKPVRDLRSFSSMDSRKPVIAGAAWSIGWVIGSVS